ncbi:MAG: rhodanese-like domain-containing protein [Proteobacteria bacterium]|nr:rhodanese-like domain-containing protein [Pseudomonadota bacterium]MBU1708701.1 rhodanese-like domain-containing protein [Pseudomonadota bacterium]
MGEAIRISCDEARAKVQSGQALLVCAYNKEEKFNNNHLDGAVSFADFSEMASKLPKDKEIIFYCA